MEAGKWIRKIHVAFGNKTDSCINTVYSVQTINTSSGKKLCDKLSTVKERC